MIFSVEKRTLDIRHRIARQNALLHGFAQALFHRGNELSRHRAADDRVHKFELSVRRTRLETDIDHAELPRAARLFFMFAFGFRRPADRLFIRDLGFSQIDFATEFRFQFLAKDFELGLALPANDHFARFLILFHFEGEIFFRQPVEPLEDLVFVAALTRVNRHGKHGFGECDGREHDLLVFIAQSVARIGGVELAHRADIARAKFFNRFLFFPFQKIQLVDSFLFARAHIEHRYPAFQRAGKYPEHIELADEGIDGRFEHLRRKRSGRVARDFDRFSAFVFRDLRRHFIGRRHQIDDLFHQVDDAHVLRGGTAHNRNTVARGDTDFDTRDDVVVGKRAFGEILIQKLFGIFRRGFDKPVLDRLHPARHIRGNGNGNSAALCEFVSLARYYGNVAFHLAAVHNGRVHRGDAFAVFIPERFHRGNEIRIFFINTVHENNERIFMTQTKVHHLFRAHAYGAVCVRHEHNARRRAHRFLRLALEIVKARHVDDIDLGIPPYSICDGKRNRNLLCNLLLVIVHDGIAVRRFSQTVDRLAVEKHCFSKGGFTLAAVPYNRYVSDVSCLEFTHVVPFLILNSAKKYSPVTFPAFSII